MYEKYIQKKVFFSPDKIETTLLLQCHMVIMEPTDIHSKHQYIHTKCSEDSRYQMTEQNKLMYQKVTVATENKFVHCQQVKYEANRQ